MKTIRSLAAALPLALVLFVPADELRFDPEKGASLAKELSIDLELAIEDMTATFNGEEMPPEALAGDLGEKVNAKMRVAVTDRYVDSKAGRALELLRTFEELALDVEAAGSSESVEDFSKLEGKTVRFKWDDEQQEYGKTYHESTGEDAALIGLIEDMDLRVLLPGKAVQPGDTWEVSGEKLGPLFLPGGLVAAVEDGEDADEARAVLEGYFEDHLKEKLGAVKVRCKYTGAKEEEGAQLGEIELALDNEVALDLGALVAQITELQQVDGMPTPDFTGELRVELKGDGTLLWNQRANRVHAFDLATTFDLGVTMDISVDAEGETMEMSFTADAAGKVDWKLATKIPD